MLDKARGLLWHPQYTGLNPVALSRAVEAEVRKDDEALIRQLVDALELADKIRGYPNNKKIIAVARARLESETLSNRSCVNHETYSNKEH